MTGHFCLSPRPKARPISSTTTQLKNSAKSRRSILNTVPKSCSSTAKLTNSSVDVGFRSSCSSDRETTSSAARSEARQLSSPRLRTFVIAAWLRGNVTSCFVALTLFRVMTYGLGIYIAQEQLARVSATNSYCVRFPPGMFKSVYCRRGQYATYMIAALHWPTLSEKAIQ